MKVERQRSFVYAAICRTICFLDPTATIYSLVHMHSECIYILQSADEGCS